MNDVKALSFWPYVCVLILGSLALSDPTPAPVSRPKLVTEDQAKEMMNWADKKIGECRREKCAQMKTYQQFRKTLRALIDEIERGDFLKDENSSLRNAATAWSASKTIRLPIDCQRKYILDRLMLDYGISETGNIVYSKTPVDTEGATCWSNARNKKDATLILCDYKWRLTVVSHGGGALKKRSFRHREYYFDIGNSCDLISALVEDENQKGKKQTFLTYKTCLEEWNKRGSDAAMSSEQVHLMEDTIGSCFRLYLLPERTSKTGREDPSIPPPKDSGIKPGG